MSFVRGSNSALSSSSFFFSSSSSISKPSFVVDLSFFPVILFHWVHHVEHLQTLLAKALQEGRGGDSRDAFPCDVEDVILTLLHSVYILLQANLLITRLGCVEAEELGNLSPVCGVFMHAKLEALAKLLVELLVVVFLLGNLAEHFQALLHQVLLDDPQDLVLLKSLAGDVQRQVLGVNYTFHHVEPLGHEFVTVVHDEHSTHIELDVVPLLLRLEEVERCASRHEEQCTELELALNTKVLHRKVVLPVIRERLVERGVLLIGDILGFAHPERFVLVQLLPLVGHLLDFLGLLLLRLLLLLLINFLDLRLITFLALCILLFLLLVLRVCHLLLLGFFDVELDGEANELRVLLHQILQAALLEEFGLVLLEVADHFRSPLHLAVDKFGILLDCEGAACARLPDVLLVIVVLADNTHLITDKVGTVKADTKLANHGDVTTGSHGFHEGFGT